MKINQINSRIGFCAYYNRLELHSILVFLILPSNRFRFSSVYYQRILKSRSFKVENKMKLPSNYISCAVTVTNISATSAIATVPLHLLHCSYLFQASLRLFAFPSFQRMVQKWILISFIFIKVLLKRPAPKAVLPPDVIKCWNEMMIVTSV